MKLLPLAMVGLAAMLGAWSRWLLDGLFNTLLPSIPLGTLIANLAGSFLMGLALVLLLEYKWLPPALSTAVIVGFLGSFTTMSAFSAQAMVLITQTEYLLAAAHIALHVAGSIVMVFTGVAVARLMV